MLNIFLSNIKIVIAGFILILGHVNLFAQSHEKIYDHYNDTLILINEFFIDTHKVLLKREQVLSIDSLVVNQRGLRVKSFNFSAITLGHSVQIPSEGSKFTSAMHDEINNKKMRYKFINIKDIVLQSDDGRRLSPSIKSIKISFSN